MLLKMTLDERVFVSSGRCNWLRTVFKGGFFLSLLRPAVFTCTHFVQNSFYIGGLGHALLKTYDIQNVHLLHEVL
jgi:hypothetical protein